MSTTNSLRHDAYASDYDQQVQAAGCYLAEALFGLCFEYVRPNQQLLDLGIGSGLSAAPFAKAGLQVQGMDFSQAMLDLCSAKGITSELKQHDLQETPWPFPAQVFDHLICCGVLHFLGDLETIFEEARRVLREGGNFAFTTKAPQAIHSSMQKYSQQRVDGFDIFSHRPEYVVELTDQFQFKRMKQMRCFVGQETFDVWVISKIRE
jgi:predicted TPR repeat methyltransferase